jgi:hypothetical protein
MWILYYSVWELGCSHHVHNLPRAAKYRERVRPRLHTPQAGVTPLCYQNDNRLALEVQTASNVQTSSCNADIPHVSAYLVREQREAALRGLKPSRCRLSPWCHQMHDCVRKHLLDTVLHESVIATRKIRTNHRQMQHLPIIELKAIRHLQMPVSDRIAMCKAT